MTIKSKFSNNKVTAFFVVAFNAIIMLFCVFFLVPTFMNNDDVLINYIVSGAFGEPSAVTFYNNIIFSSGLVSLHSLFPEVNWLAVIEILLLFTAFCLVGFIVISKSKTTFSITVSVAFSLIFGADFYNSLQYSKIVPFVALVGIVSVLFGVLNKQTVVTVLGALITVSSSLIRFNVFLIGAALGFFVVVQFIFKFNKQSKFKFDIDKKLLTIFCLVFLIIFGLKLYDVYFYSTDPLAKEYSDYNNARMAVSDYFLPDYEQNETEFQTLGISSNDHKLIDSWNFSDFEKFGTQTLDDISEISSPDINYFFETVSKGLSEIFLNDLLYYMLLVVVVSVVVCKNKAKNLFVPLFSFLFVVTVMFILGRATRWVSAGIVAALFALLLFTLDLKQFRFDTKQKAIKRCAVIIILFLSIIPISLLCVNEISEDYNTHFRTDLNAVHSSLPSQNLYLFDIATFPPIERTSPTFSSAPKGLYQNTYILGGWDSNSPAKNSVLERYSIQGSPYKALVEQQNVFLIDNFNLQNKVTFIQENYFPESFVSILEYIEGYPIYSFTTVPDFEIKGGFPIVDMADLICEANSEFTSFAIKVEGEVPVGEEIKVLFVDNDTGKTSAYRAKISDFKDGTSVILFCAPLSDFNFFSEYTVNILTQQNNNYFAHDPYLFRF